MSLLLSFAGAVIPSFASTVLGFLFSPALMTIVMATGVFGVLFVLRRLAKLRFRTMLGVLGLMVVVLFWFGPLRGASSRRWGGASTANLKQAPKKASPSLKKRIALARAAADRRALMGQAVMPLPPMGGPAMIPIMPLMPSIPSIPHLTSFARPNLGGGPVTHTNSAATIHSPVVFASKPAGPAISTAASPPKPVSSQTSPSTLSSALAPPGSTPSTSLSQAQKPATPPPATQSQTTPKLGNLASGGSGGLFSQSGMPAKPVSPSSTTSTPAKPGSTGSAASLLPPKKPENPASQKRPTPKLDESGTAGSVASLSQPKKPANPATQSRTTPKINKSGLADSAMSPVQFPKADRPASQARTTSKRGAHQSLSNGGGVSDSGMMGGNHGATGGQPHMTPAQIRRATIAAQNHQAGLMMEQVMTHEMGQMQMGGMHPMGGMHHMGGTHPMGHAGGMHPAHHGGHN